MSRHGDKIEGRPLKDELDHAEVDLYCLCSLAVFSDMNTHAHTGITVCPVHHCIVMETDVIFETT